MFRYYYRALFFVLTCLGLSVAVNAQNEKLVDYVKPFVGTDGYGNVYPGAQIPFGGIQISPDTDNKYYDAASGYKYNRPTIMGFSLTHLSGTGIPDLGDFLFIPGIGDMMGGQKAFVNELELMFSTPLGKGRPDFYHQFGDHTGNVGQFSMGNEPAMHIPYLYNYAGEPWRTQKRVRSLLSQWFRNDLMGIPGDEDGGGLTSFVVFSMMGFYPVTPGLPMDKSEYSHP